MVVIVVFEVILCPLTEKEVGVGVQCVFAIVLIALLISGLLCSLINPIDSLPLDQSTNAYCTLCKRYTHPDSKHCTRCSKCIQHFDHHCKWINNCIGARNYRPFAVMITSLELTLGTVLFTSLYTAIRLFESARNEGVHSRLTGKTVQSGEAYGYGTCILAFSVLLAYLFVLTSRFLSLQVYLRCTGQTLYSYIKDRRGAVVAQTGGSLYHEAGEVNTETELGSKLPPLQSSGDDSVVQPQLYDQFGDVTGDSPTDPKVAI